MKTTTALIAAGLLAASLPAYAQGVQPLPPNLQNPLVASQASSDIFAMMELMQKMALQQKAAARESRDVARESQFAAMEGAAEKMKQAAAATLAQAQVASAMAIASGAMSVGAGQAAQTKPSASGKGQQATIDTKAQAGAGGISGIGQMKAPTKALTPQEKQQAMSAMANVQQTFAANMAAAEADKKKAEATQQQAQAANAQQAQAQQMMQQMQDVMRDVQQKLLAIQQSQAATIQAIMRN